MEPPNEHLVRPSKPAHQEPERRAECAPGDLRRFTQRRQADVPGGQGRPSVADQALTLQIDLEKPRSPPQVDLSGPVVGGVRQRHAAHGVVPDQVDAVVLEARPRELGQQLPGLEPNIEDRIDERKRQVHRVWTRLANHAAREAVGPVIGNRRHVVGGRGQEDSHAPELSDRAVARAFPSLDEGRIEEVGVGRAHLSSGFGRGCDDGVTLFSADRHRLFDQDMGTTP